MPANYRFDFNIIVIYMAGECTINDLRTALLRSLADPERPPDSFLLFDFEESQSFYTRPAEEIQTMADFITSMRNRYNYRLAVVSSHELPYILQRFISVKSEALGIDADVFHSYDEAREWLVTKHFHTSRQAQAARITKTQKLR